MLAPSEVQLDDFDGLLTRTAHEHTIQKCCAIHSIASISAIPQSGQLVCWIWLCFSSRKKHASIKLSQIFLSTGTICLQQRLFAERKIEHCESCVRSIATSKQNIKSVPRGIRAPAPIQIAHPLKQIQSILVSPYLPTCFAKQNGRVFVCAHHWRVRRIEMKRRHTWPCMKIRTWIHALSHRINRLGRPCSMHTMKSTRLSTAKHIDNGSNGKLISISRWPLENRRLFTQTARFLCRTHIRWRRSHTFSKCCQ